MRLAWSMYGRSMNDLRNYRHFNSIAVIFRICGRIDQMTEKLTLNLKSGLEVGKSHGSSLNIR